MLKKVISKNVTEIWTIFTFTHVRQTCFAYKCPSRYLTYQTLPGRENNLIIPGHRELSKWHPGWGRENR